MSKIIPIPPSRFTNSKTIYEVVFGNECKGVDEGVFENCCNLSTINENNVLEQIGNRAFFGTKISHVTFNYVKTIGNSAFGNCTSLKTISINTGCSSIGNSAFKGCTSIESFVIPTGVETIMDNTFSGCSSLKEIEISKGVKTIGFYAFYECKSLKTVYNFSNFTFSKGSKDHGYVAYYADKVYNALNGSKEGNFIFGKPNGVNTLLYYLGNATELTLPANYNGESYAIGTAVFKGNTTIKSVTIGSNVTSIGDGAFHGCSNLTSITIPNSVTSIGDAAFAYCDGLTSITIPNSVTSIGDGAFRGCSEITSIVVDGKNTKYDSRNNCNAIIETSSNTLMAGCINTVIPTNVTTIGNHAFDGCSGLTKIAIPDSVTEIGDSAFYGCSGLESIVIPESITVIGGHAFYKCSKITEISIPDKVKSIGEFAFFNCTGIKTVKNYSISFKLERGKDTYGYVACYADKVYNYFTINNYNFINENGVNRLVEYTGSDENINLPIISLNNYNEEEYIISNDVFKNNTTITTITIPISVKNIGDNAFDGCTNLNTIINYSNITLAKGEYGIGDNIVKIINAPNGFEHQSAILFFNESGGITFAYYSGTATKYTIPEKYGDHNNYKYITSIGDYAFVGNSSIQTIEIPNTITTIGNYAFKGVEGINTIIVGSSVSSIGEEAFYDCSNIETIYNFSGLKFEKGSTNYGYIAKNAKTIYNYSGGSKEGDYLFDEIDGKYILMKYVGYGGNLYLPNNCKGESYDIGDNAFRNNTTITSVEIPSGVSNIGNYAFSGCSGLTSVEIPNTNNEIKIGDWAFSGCSGLNSVTIPTNVTKIGGSAFDSCSSLKNVNYNAANCETIIVASNAIFDNCSSLTEITIGENVNKIPTYLFNNCSSLTNITIPNSVTSIEYCAFFNCKSLTSIEIPNSVINIGESTFHGCSNLTNITLPDSITSINWYMFYNCTNLTHITIPNNVKSIGQYSFSGCNKLTSIVIGKNVASIGTDAFAQTNIKTIYNCSNLTLKQKESNYGGVAVNAVTIYGKETNMTSADYKYIGATIIDDYLFNVINDNDTLIKYFGKKETINLPENYDGKEYIIGMSSFYNTNIINVTIPNYVTKIENLSFSNCSKLQNIYLNNTTPPEIETNVFLTTSNNNNFKIYVPKGSGDIYKEKWQEYSNYIVEQQ